MEPCCHTEKALQPDVGGECSVFHPHRQQWGFFTPLGSTHTSNEGFFLVYIEHGAWFFILVTHTQLKNIIWKRNYLLNGVRWFFFAFCFYCRYLISQGANVGGVNSEGETPLDIAEEEAMEELLQNEINRQGTFTPGAHSVAQMLSKHSKTLRR